MPAYPITPPGEEFFEWGVECWQFGSNNFFAKIAGGVPVQITRIVGSITCSALSGALISSTNLRASLVSFGPAATATPDAVVFGAPGGVSFNQSIAAHLFNVVARQMGNNVMVVPFDYSFATFVINDPNPANNLLLMNVNNLTTDTSGSIVTPATECVDAEIQCTVYFRRT